MSYEVKYTSRFKRDYKRMQRRGKEMSKLLDVIDMPQSPAAVHRAISWLRKHHFVFFYRNVDFATTAPSVVL